MPPSRIADWREADQVTVVYRLPGRWFAPVALLWCVVGGLALAIGLTLALIVAGITDPSGQGWLTTRVSLAGGTLLGACALYGLVYLPAAWRQYLCVIFDYRDTIVTIELTNSGRRPVHYLMQDVIAFRLAEQAVGREVHCALIMETAGAGPVPLVISRHPCHEDKSDLAQLVGRLSGRIYAIQNHQDTFYNEPIPPVPAVRPAWRQGDDDDDD